MTARNAVTASSMTVIFRRMSTTLPGRVETALEETGIEALGELLDPPRIEPGQRSDLDLGQLGPMRQKSPEQSHRIARERLPEIFVRHQLPDHLLHMTLAHDSLPPMHPL